MPHDVNLDRCYRYYFKFIAQSGNYGNLFSCLLSRKLGLPIKNIISANNINNPVEKYILTGKYKPQPSKRTLSNAMDVGSPSNFVRVKELFESNLDRIRKVLYGYSFSDTQTTSYGISLNQAVFDLPAWYQFKSGKALSASAQAQFASDQQTLIIRVTNAYLSVLRAFDNNETRKAEQRAIFRQLEQTKERFEVGLLPITDVHEAQAIFDDASVNTLEAKGALNIAFDNLEVLTGERYDSLSGLSDNFLAENPNPVDSSSWVAFALQNNFDIKIAKFGKDASYNQAKAAASELYPRLTASARYSDSDTDGSQISYLPSESSSNISSLNDGHSINLSFSMPIWSSGLNASSRQAKQRAIASDESYEAVKRTTAQNARAQHQLVITNAARVKARSQAITSAESALNATQAGYEVGTRNIVDVLSAQRALFQAKRNYANSKYDYIYAMMSLKQVAGQLSPDDIYQLNARLDPKIQVIR